MNEITVLNENNGILANMTTMLTFAETVAKSGLCPAGMDTKEKVFVAVEWGKELGLSPMVALNNIAVVNGKPSLSTDIMSAIVMNNPQYRGLQWLETSEKRAECVISRYINGKEIRTSGIYTIEDATKADLLKKDNWKKYPARMLQKRALSFALRDAFPDILAGIYSPDEIQLTEEDVQIIEPAPHFDSFDEPTVNVRAEQVEFE